MTKAASPFHIIGQDIYLETNTLHSPTGSSFTAKLVSGATVFFSKTVYASDGKYPDMTRCLQLLLADMKDFVDQVGDRILKAANP